MWMRSFANDLLESFKESKPPPLKTTTLNSKPWMIRSARLNSGGSKGGMKVDKRILNIF